MEHSECVFCQIVNSKINAEIIYERDNIIVFLDNDPINEGHILIIPKDHLLDLDDLPICLAEEIMNLATLLVKVLKNIYIPDGYSIMQNGGKFNDIGHFHLHVFPRYIEDQFGWTCSDSVFPTDESVGKIIKSELNSIMKKY